jgi:hydrogenase maturation protease
MSVSTRPLTVLGIGNTMLRDDGVGVRVVEALEVLARRDPTLLPPDTRLVDGGVLDLDLLRVVEGARALLLIDGVDLGWAPGTVAVLRGDAIPAAGRRVGASTAGSVGELVAVARLMGWLPEHVSLLGVQVEEVAFGAGLTRTAEGAVPRALELAGRELWMLDAAARDQPTVMAIANAGGLA